MDKETLSNYGWIVILVLILAVLLALATPFGNFIAGAIKATTAGFFSVNQEAMGVAGITIPGQGYEGEPAPCNIEGHYIGDGRGEHMIPVDDCTSNHTYTCECDGWVVPENGTYYIGVTSTATGDYTGATITYTAGQKLPCGYTPQIGDVYTNEEYEHRYNFYCGWRPNGGGEQWYLDQDQHGWGVRVLDDTKQSYGAILESINGEPITTLDLTFYDCTSLTTAPKIPKNATNMRYTFLGCTSLTYVPDMDTAQNLTDINSTFQGCTSLKVAPKLPNNVTDMTRTFGDCTSLKTAPEIPSSVISMPHAFTGCTSLTYVPDMDTAQNLTDIMYTFQGCTSLKVAPKLPNNVIDMQSTFEGCSSLEVAPILPTKVENLCNVFKDCTSLKTYHGNTKEDGNFTDYIIPSGVTDFRYAFENCTSLKAAPAVPNRVVDLYATFKGCTSLVVAPDLTNATSLKCMDYTFENCSSLRIPPTIPNGVVDLYACFSDCSNLITAPAIPESATNISAMFYLCYALRTGPDLSNAVNLTYMESTFAGCRSLTGTIIVPLACKGQKIGYSDVIYK